MYLGQLNPVDSISVLRSRDSAVEPTSLADLPTSGRLIWARTPNPNHFRDILVIKLIFGHVVPCRVPPGASLAVTMV